MVEEVGSLPGEQREPVLSRLAPIGLGEEPLTELKHLVWRQLLVVLHGLSHLGQLEQHETSVDPLCIMFDFVNTNYTNLARRTPSRGDEWIIWGLVSYKSHDLVRAKKGKEAFEFSHTDPEEAIQRRVFFLHLNSRSRSTTIT